MDAAKSPLLSEGDFGGEKALLFINGEPPKILPEITDYQIVGCTDGAFFYLEEKGFDLNKLTLFPEILIRKKKLMNYKENQKFLILKS